MTAGTEGTRQRMWRAAVVALVLLFAWPLAGCQRATPTTAAIVRSHVLAQYPEYRLYYPGSALLGQGGLDAETGPFSYRGASAGATLGVDASPEEVAAFYTRELAARGWQTSDIAGVSDTGELRADGWRKGHIAFRLGVERKGDPRNPSAYDSYRTTYTIRLRADDPRDSSWQSHP